MKHTYSKETYESKAQYGLLNVEIIHLSEYSTFIVLKDNFKFDEESNLWNFNQYHLVIPSFYNVVKEDILKDFSNWIIVAKDNETLNKM